jgi:hypothetical protein
MPFSLESGGIEALMAIRGLAHPQTRPIVNDQSPRQFSSLDMIGFCIELPDQRCSAMRDMTVTHIQRIQASCFFVGC